MYANQSLEKIDIGKGRALNQRLSVLIYILLPVALVFILCSPRIMHFAMFYCSNIDIVLHAIYTSFSVIMQLFKESSRYTLYARTFVTFRFIKNDIKIRQPNFLSHYLNNA